MILTWNSYTVCNFSPVKRRAGKTLINRHPHETRREALPRAGSVGDSPRRLFEGERREETKNTIMNHGSWQWFQWNSMVSDVCFINDRCWWLFGSFLFVIFCSWNVVTRCCKKLSSKIDQSDLDGIWEASKVNLLAGETGAMKFPGFQPLWILVCICIYMIINIHIYISMPCGAICAICNLQFSCFCRAWLGSSSDSSWSWHPIDRTEKGWVQDGKKRWKNSRISIDFPVPYFFAKF